MFTSLRWSNWKVLYIILLPKVGQSLTRSNGRCHKKIYLLYSRQSFHISWEETHKKKLFICTHELTPRAWWCDERKNAASETSYQHFAQSTTCTFHALQSVCEAWIIFIFMMWDIEANDITRYDDPIKNDTWSLSQNNFWSILKDSTQSRAFSQSF